MHDVCVRVCVCVARLMVIDNNTTQKRPENESEKSSSSDTGEPESWRLRRRRFRWQQSLHLLHISRTPGVMRGWKRTKGYGKSGRRRWLAIGGMDGDREGEWSSRARAKCANHPAVITTATRRRTARWTSDAATRSGTTERGAIATNDYPAATMQDCRSRRRRRREDETGYAVHDKNNVIL